MVIKFSNQKVYYNYMEIRDNDKICIFAPLSPNLDKYESARLAKNINSESREVAIDLQYVEDCTIDFIELLRKISKIKEIGIFNIPSDIFTLINIMGIDKVVKIFVNELDFEENQRQLINRRFSIAK
jgi:anti-anti-sigma regulatory factor